MPHFPGISPGGIAVSFYDSEGILTLLSCDKPWHNGRAYAKIYWLSEVRSVSANTPPYGPHWRGGRNSY